MQDPPDTTAAQTRDTRQGAGRGGQEETAMGQSGTGRIAHVVFGPEDLVAVFALPLPSPPHLLERLERRQHVERARKRAAVIQLEIHVVALDHWCPHIIMSRKRQQKRARTMVSQRQRCAYAVA